MYAFKVGKYSHIALSLKAYMKSYIQLETAPIFFPTNLIKTGFQLGVCHDWLHLHGLTRPVRSANRKLQNEKFMPTMGFEPGTFRIRSERATRWAIRADKYRSPKGECILPKCVIKSYLYHLVNVVKRLTLYSQQTSKISQTARRYKYYMRKIHDKISKNNTGETKWTRGTGNLHRKLK